MGSYRELAADKNGAFAKLMEWQMSGPPKRKEEVEGHEELTEEERMRLRMQEHDKEKGRESPEEEEDSERSSEEEAEWEKVKVKDGNQSAAENPVEKAGLRDGGFSHRKGYGNE